MLALEFTLYSQPPRTVYGWRGITKQRGILNRVAPLTLHSAYLCQPEVEEALSWLNQVMCSSIL
jgi:hypothetical protein